MKYSPPMTYDEMVAKAPRLANDKVHSWRAKNGIELIHEEPTVKEQRRIWRNWLLMSRAMKRRSDAMSKEVFGMDNEEHHKAILEKIRALAEARRCDKPGKADQTATL